MRKLLVVSFLIILILISPICFADPVGEVYQVGTSVWDFHNTGSIGRMIAYNKDSLFFSWTCINTEFPLGINFNILYPDGQWLDDSSGIKISSPNFAARFVDLALLVGDSEIPTVPIICYKIQGSPFIGIAHFFQEDTIQTYLPNGISYVLPHIAADILDHVHLLTLNIENVGGPYYLNYQHSDDGGFTFNDIEVIDSTLTAADLVVSSRYGTQSAILYAKPRIYNLDSSNSFNNDLALLKSDNGSVWDWEHPLNLTRFVDTDTFRLGFDESAFFDNMNWLHIAFPTLAYYHYVDHDSVNTSSVLWHWSDLEDSFTVIAYGWNESNPGVWHLSIDRPSLAYNEENGWIYCVYEKFDNIDTSIQGYSNGEIWATVSTDNGINWSEGINITNTISPGCYPGDCNSEVFPSAAEVVNDTLHVFYCLDKDAGGAVNNPSEGTLTNNPMIYQKIPCSLIPTTPLIPQNVSIHVRPDAVDDQNIPNLPNSISLSACPNPFNSATTITIAGVKQAEIGIYDITGRLITSLHMVGSQALWDASAYTSGLYFARVAGEKASTIKLVLVK
jgi:hypothetical protein